MPIPSGGLFMDPIALSRMQFAITTIYHFFFVPLTLGLSILVAIMETIYVRTGKEVYKRMAKFWGKLFLINFAMGVVTGIVQEFQFGMNWSEYSRFVGDVFGAPLAIEALTAFFLESTFLGIWIFGWDKLPKRVHAATIWLVALGSNLSALWILIANSFMHEPTGYVLQDGRAEMIDFPALLTNKHALFQFPHTITAGITTAAFFVLGISAYNLWKGKGEKELFQISFRWGAIYSLIGVLLVGVIGHFQADYIHEAQPMKMAAAEAIWETEDPADFLFIAISDQDEGRNVFELLRVPGLTSFLYNFRFSGEVEGINELQQQLEDQYGPGDYIPPVNLIFWTFRIMVGVGFLLLFISFLSLYLVFTKKLGTIPRILKFLPFVLFLPYVANTAGWLMTEIGRQPWIVYGLLRVEDAISPNLPASTILFTLIAFTLLYGVLMVADIYLLAKFAIRDVEGQDEPDLTAA
jgi:cytochrome d ubiquinol oxidase subunit I